MFFQSLIGYILGIFIRPKLIEIQAMNLNNKLLILLFTLISAPTFAEQNFEIPILSLVKMNYNDVDPSSDPEVMMRQFEYISSASPEELLKFYRASEYIKSCDYNDMADNYICQLTKHGKVSSGYVFIPSKSKQGHVKILADYFFTQ